jgi:hypothetical protein
MKRLILVCLSVLLLVGVVYGQATSVQINIVVDGVTTTLGPLTARQTAMLNRRVSEFNAQRTANGQSTVTMGVYLRGFIVNALQSESDQAERDEQAEACAALNALAPAARATELARPVWGGKSPCR